MSKYEDRVAKTLYEVSNQCGHPPQNRGVDLETADEFCADCGRVTQQYVPGTRGRFPGNRASTLIVDHVKAELPDRVISARLFYVDPVGPDKFHCYMQVSIDGSLQHRYFILTREGADENVRVVPAEKPGHLYTVWTDS